MTVGPSWFELPVPPLAVWLFGFQVELDVRFRFEIDVEFDVAFPVAPSPQRAPRSAGVLARWPRTGNLDSSIHPMIHSVITLDFLNPESKL